MSQLVYQPLKLFFIYRITEAISSSKGDPANYLIAVRYIETLKEMVSGKNNKVVYLPYEATGVLSSIGGIKDMLTGLAKKKLFRNFNI